MNNPQNQKLKNSYEFFSEESRNYERILLNYQKDKSNVFCDPNFHPNNNISESKSFKKIFNNAEWKRIDDIYTSPLFDKKLINQDYIAQGEIGNCYFISSLSRIAKQPNLVIPLFEKKLPDKILGEVTDSINIKCGAVVIYFQAFGRRTPVLIDTLIPTKNGKPIFSYLLDNSKSGWFCLVEKAFAKLNGSYSNIESGFYSESIYSLFGYNYEMLIIQPKKNRIYTQVDKYNEKQDYIDLITDYENNGCIMDASIHTDYLTDITTKDIEGKGLIDKHSYLILKTTRFNDNIFFLLRNPWGKFVWNGHYSKDSPLWTPELRKILKPNFNNGEFWMIDNDFFKYFTTINVSKPFEPTMIIRYCCCSLQPTNKQISENDTYNYQNFVFQLVQPIPKEHKATFNILLESRFSEFVPNIESVTNLITIARSNGQKLTPDFFNGNKDYATFPVSNHIFSFSVELMNSDDIITFVIHPKEQIKETINFYIRVFCEYDFKLYDVDNPGLLNTKAENPTIVFSNFTRSDPLKGKAPHQACINGKTVICLGEPKSSDFDPDKNDKIDDVIYKNCQNANETHYCHLGPQLNLDGFIFGSRSKLGANFGVYTATEFETNKKFTVLSSRCKICDIRNFAGAIEIRQKLKFPSIVEYIGFSEINIKRKDFPLFFVGYYSNGSLLEILQRNASKITDNNNNNNNENGKVKDDNNNSNDNNNDNLNDNDNNNNNDNLNNNDNNNDNLNDNDNNNSNDNNNNNEYLNDNDNNNNNDNLNDNFILNNTKKMIILIGIAYAMLFIHKNDIIHYDLKCSGIFLDENFYPRVGDLGHARYKDEEPRELQIDEQPYFVAPELIDKSSDISFPVDVFAYGMVFYHVISNIMPMIECKSAIDLQIKIQNGARPKLDCIPQKFHEFLEDLWHQEPERRPAFSNIVDFLNDKNNWLEDVDQTEIEAYKSIFLEKRQEEKVQSKKDCIIF